MMENKLYWKEAVKILKTISDSNDKVSTSELMKNLIKDTIVRSISKDNYLVAKLLIRSRITEPILLNFLFYNAINKEKTLKLFIESPSKYCNTYMFNISPENLPDINLIFNQNEVELLSLELNAQLLLNEIGKCSVQKLKTLFPRAAHFENRNPYSSEIY